MDGKRSQEKSREVKRVRVMGCAGVRDRKKFGCVKRPLACPYEETGLHTKMLYRQ